MIDRGNRNSFSGSAQYACLGLTQVRLFFLSYSCIGRTCRVNMKTYHGQSLLEHSCDSCLLCSFLSWFRRDRPRTKYVTTSTSFPLRRRHMRMRKKAKPPLQLKWHQQNHLYNANYNNLSLSLSVTHTHSNSYQHHQHHHEQS